MAERLDIVSQSNFPTNKSNTVEIVTTTKKKVTTASASDIATLVTPAISNLDIATQTNFPIQSSDAQSDFIITTDGDVYNVTAEDAAGLISSYIPTGGGDPHKPDFTADYSTNYSDFSNFTGSGTEADPYQIWDEEMFLNARFKVNKGGLSSATYFKQMRDINWHFDGIGWAMYINHIYVYNTDNTEVIAEETYGIGTSQGYSNYDGDNHTLTVLLDGFVYTEDFLLSLINFTGEHGNITNSTSSSYFSFNFEFIRARNIKNLTFTVKNQISVTPANLYLYISLFSFIDRFENVIVKDITWGVIPNVSFEHIIIQTNSYGTLSNSQFLNISITKYTELKVLRITASIDNLLIENCRFLAATNYITYYTYNSNINNLHINNCKINAPSSTDAVVKAKNLSNSNIENSIINRSESGGCYLVKATNIYNTNIRNIYSECRNFTAFSIDSHLYGCSVLGYISCKQLANDGEFYIMKYTGSSALPEGEYAVNSCKNACIFLVDSNSYTYNSSTHRYSEANTTTSNGDETGCAVHHI